MSADNGYIVRVHPNGGFCLVGYSMSCLMEDIYETPDGYPLADEKLEQFPSIQAALNVNQDYMDGYWSEYGIHLDNEVKNIQSALLHELHETVESPNWDLKLRCSCGERSDNNLRHYMHQADSLREQLRQLG